jgi:hypothetical protein
VDAMQLRIESTKKKFRVVWNRSGGQQTLSSRCQGGRVEVETRFSTLLHHRT